jgi:hypothetical protein
MRVCGRKTSGSVHGQMTVSCEHDDVTSVSIKAENCILAERVSAYQERLCSMESSNDCCKVLME